MKNFFWVALAALALTAFGANNYPIVLWHGFAGFGRDNFVLPGGRNALYYWGFLQGDLESYLKDQGHEVYTLSVGPVSSSWDRVCEAFAQLKGGTVDFGLAHSAKHGHERFQRTYKGMIPDWGEVDPKTGEIKKVHIIAHSMGGKDAQLFASLLENGFEAEVKVTGAGTSTLFTGNHPWVASITTISAPHDGTSLASSVQVFFPWLKDLIIAIVGLAGLTPLDVVYDFKLDHWGLAAKDDEKLTDYIDRVLSSEIWFNNEDISLIDLSPEGAKKINENHQLISIPYFSYETEATWKGIGVPFHYPDATMFVALWPTATLMGAFTRPGFGGLVPIGSDWYPNDGIVNTRSMAGPTLGVSNKVIEYNGRTVHLGIYNYLGKVDHVDHLAVVGAGILFQIRPFYRDLAKFLKSLDISSSLSEGPSAPLIPAFAAASEEQSPTTDPCAQHEVYGKMCSPAAIYPPASVDSCSQLATQLQYCAAATPGVNLSLGAIIGIVAGAFAVVAVGAWAFVTIVRRRKIEAEYQPIKA